MTSYLVKFPITFPNEDIILKHEDLGKFCKKYNLYIDQVHRSFNYDTHHKGFRFQKLTPEMEARIKTVKFLKWRNSQNV